LGTFFERVACAVSWPYRRALAERRVGAAGWRVVLAGELVFASGAAAIAAAGVAALLAGCFDPRPLAGGACAPGNRCPSSLTCIEGVCVSGGGDGQDGGPEELLDGRLADAAIDGPAPPLQCPIGYTQVLPNVCHRKFAQSTTWTAAEARCELDAAHLVIPSSLEEARLVGGSAWIGLSDRKVESTFRTVTGRLPTFTYWEGETPPMSEPLDCAFANPNSRWQDGPCDFSFPFVCEYDGVKADPTAF
jgi:Lectin C-type domain